MEKIMSITIILILLLTTIYSVNAKTSSTDIDVIVEINRIRALDVFKDPDFYVKITIYGEEFVSPTWDNSRYIEKPGWSATKQVSDTEEFVDITIELFDKNSGTDTKCDINGNGALNSINHAVNIQYNLKTGHWEGDDSIEDPSGYGRLNGCSDGSIYKIRNDCELWFHISQTDPDGDGIPSWIETNQYGTDPGVDDTGTDADNDDVPIEWEYRWGYDPNVWDDHENLDPEGDGIENTEEYKMSEWVYSDPYRKDLFVELDLMEEGPNGEITKFPDGSKDLLRNVYDRQNVVYWLDDGSWTDSGSEIIPFEAKTDWYDLNSIYNNYFLHNNQNNWRKGVFHYGLVIYNCTIHHGCCFRYNAFQISSKGVNDRIYFNTQKWTDTGYASVYMHETGHTLGIFHSNTPGCDDPNSGNPFQPNWWKWLPYRSCMNYGYTYRLVDYSDGSRPFNDFNDWGNLDFLQFQNGW